jgi:sugar lactone lactonase YvrE
VIPHVTPELFADVRLQVGESPLWDAEAARFTFVDILGRLVLTATADGAVTMTVPTPDDVGAALPAAGGGWLLAMRDRFATLDEAGAVEDLISVASIGGGVRFNDAKCDPVGRAFAGTMGYRGEAGVGTLFRLDDGPAASVVLARTSISNGLGWSPDGRSLYFIDSAVGAIAHYAYDPDSGELGTVRGLIPVEGFADGLCVDDAGCLWVAVFGGSQIRRYAPDGEVDMVIDLPVTQPTSCAFGGPDGDLLVITTANHLLTAAQRADQPLAGAVFAVQLAVAAAGATLWHGVSS